nr:hypothetical protein [Tanacetum cinerariifolium]
MNAINNVFPSARNLLCVWHIEKNVVSNCKRFFEHSEEFNDFIEKKDAIAYVKKNWFPWKEKFVSAWTEKHLHFGNRSSSRAEGFVCVWYGKQFFSPNGGGVGRGVKEKQHGSANVNVASSASISTTALINSGNKNGTEEGNIGMCSTPISTSSASRSDGMLKDATPYLGSNPPLPSHEANSTGNAPDKPSYTNSTGKPSGTKVNFRTLYTPGGNGIDVVVPVESIRSISNRFANTAYEFFLGNRVAYRVVANYFSSMKGLNAMLENGSWFIRNNPLILKKWHPDVNLLKEDVGTIPVWVKLHGVPVQSSYARAMIELRPDVELKDNIVAAMPKIVREGYYTCNIRVEYEWKPPSCACCKIFGHVLEECPKNIGVGVTKNLKKTSQTPKGILIGQKLAFKLTKQVYQPVSKKSNAYNGENKKTSVEPTNEVSKTNSFDALNLVDKDVKMGTNGGSTHLASQEANSSGSSIWNAESSSPSTTPIMEKINKMENLIIYGKAILVDNEGNPLSKVDEDSEDEVASVDNDMANSLAKKDGYGTQSLLE